MEVKTLQLQKISQILSTFGANSGSQLKYYIVKSMFPDISKDEIIKEGILSETSFYKIKNAVDAYELPLLHFDNQADTESNSTNSFEVIQLHDLIHELIDVKAALDSQAALEEQIQELEAEINELHNNQSNFDSESYVPREDYEALERKVDLYEANWKAARHEATYFKNKYDKAYDLLKRVYEDRSKILDHYRKVEVQFMEVAGENAPPRKMWTSFTKEVRELEKVL